ncbi:MAG: hypothetical protein KAI17_03430 [Thiotrichaceae bacterium]|nr:hypothetical protein [Thiotrichaceae bacterium]
MKTWGEYVQRAKLIFPSGWLVVGIVPDNEEVQYHVEWFPLKPQLVVHSAPFWIEWRMETEGTWLEHPEGLLLHTYIAYENPQLREKNLDEQQFIQSLPSPWESHTNLEEKE